MSSSSRCTTRTLPRPPTSTPTSSPARRLDVLIAGDDEDAKGRVAALASDGGLNPIDVGPKRRARELAAAGLLHLGVHSTLGAGFGSALAIVA
jgi:8-hydroxy-5-deazaflavin:NADPH oxidoreductase